MSTFLYINVATFSIFWLVNAWKILDNVSLNISKDSDAGRDWGQKEKGMTDDEMAGWHHRLDGHESV